MPTRVLLVFCLLAYAVWAALEPVTGADTWWSMVAGRWVVQHDGVPSVDTLSYTFAGTPWFNQEWLTQVIFYLTYEWLGGTALALLKIGVVIATFVLAAWVAARRSGSLALAVAATCAAAYVCRTNLDIRAQLFTFLFALVVLAVLDAYRRGAPAAVLALLPVTIALWVNLHYGFIYGVGTCLLYAGVETAKTLLGLRESLPRRRLVPLLGAAALALAASLANPQGLHALTFPFVIVGSEGAWRDEIVEWMPPVLFGSEAFSPFWFGPWLVVQAAALAAALALAPRRVDPADALHVAVTVTMALTSRRFIPLATLVSVPFLARNLALVGERLALPLSARVQSATTAALAVLATGLLAWRAVPEARRDFAPGLFAGMTREFFFPAGAVEFLRLNDRLPARLYHLYTWAGYLLYFDPARKVFIDGRAHAVYPIEFWHESYRVEMGQPGWEAVLDRYQVNVVLWASGFAGGGHVVLRDHLMRSPSWVRVYDDGHSVVFAHATRAADWVSEFQRFALRYPETSGAQLFVYDAYLRAGNLGGAHAQLARVLKRYPDVRAKWQGVVDNMRTQARAMGSAGAWFQVAFGSEALGDRQGAIDAYHQALELLVPEPYASYAREALNRMGEWSPM
jgi:hypothetical protein